MYLRLSGYSAEALNLTLFGGLPIRYLTYLLALGAALSPTIPAQAANFYFNKPQATIAMLQQDMTSCSNMISGHDGHVPPVTAVGATAGQAAANAAVASLAGGLMAGIMAAIEQRRALETCLVVKGWRQVALSPAEDAQLHKAVAADRDGALAAFVGVDPVVFGHVSRVWANNYAEPHPLEPKPVAAGAGR